MMVVTADPCRKTMILCKVFKLPLIAVFLIVLCHCILIAEYHLNMLP